MNRAMPSLPSPSPSPTRLVGTVSPNETVSGRINAATRKQHTELNRLIIHRLSLALPPRVDSPLLYGKGLIPFARLFLLFEVEWDLLVREIQGNNVALTGSHEYQVRRWLAELRPDGLPRSERLHEDMKYLRLAAGPNIYDTPDMDREWATKMRVLIRSRPHVLVAFAWVLYMAVFSGGRWIRQQLVNAGSEFWDQENIAISPDESFASSVVSLPGFTFLSFDGSQDGEDIKATFKLRLAEAETLLTSLEKQEIIEASQQIFDYCIDTVHKLDRRILRLKTFAWISTYAPATLIVGALFVLYFFGDWRNFLRWTSQR